MVQNLLGSSTAPIVIGALSDAYNIQTALLILPAFLVISAIFFFAGSFFYERDLNKVEKVVLEAEGSGRKWRELLYYFLHRLAPGLYESIMAKKLRSEIER